MHALPERSWLILRIQRVCVCVCLFMGAKATRRKIIVGRDVATAAAATAAPRSAAAAPKCQ